MRKTASRRSNAAPIQADSRCGNRPLRRPRRSIRQDRHGLGQAQGFPRCRRSRQLHACRRAARAVAIGGVAAGLRARTGARRLAVSPPCARADPDRAGRTAAPHRARSLHEARSRPRQADRQQGAAERRTQGADDARHRRALADAAARRIHRPLSRHPPHAADHRRGTRPRHARGRRGDQAASADAARPDPAQAVLGALPCLRVARLPQALRHAEGRWKNSTTTVC